VIPGLVVAVSAVILLLASARDDHRKRHTAQRTASRNTQEGQK